MPIPEMKNGSNSNFDLQFFLANLILGNYNFDDLTKPLYSMTQRHNGHTEMIGVGDVRGGKEGWHLGQN